MGAAAMSSPCITPCSSLSACCSSHSPSAWVRSCSTSRPPSGALGNTSVAIWRRHCCHAGSRGQCSPGSGGMPRRDACISASPSGSGTTGKLASARCCASASSAMNCRNLPMACPLASWRRRMERSANTLLRAGSCRKLASPAWRCASSSASIRRAVDVILSINPKRKPRLHLPPGPVTGNADQVRSVLPPVTFLYHR